MKIKTSSEELVRMISALGELEYVERRPVTSTSHKAWEQQTDDLGWDTTRFEYRVGEPPQLIYRDGHVFAYDGITLEVEVPLKEFSALVSKFLRHRRDEDYACENISFAGRIFEFEYEGGDTVAVGCQEYDIEYLKEFYAKNKLTFPKA